MRQREFVIPICLAIALAACGSNPSRSTTNTDAKEAAELQVKLGRGYMEQGELEVAMERLQRLKDRTEAASYAEVIRNALRLYEALVAEAEQGREFAIKTPDGITLSL